MRTLLTAGTLLILACCTMTKNQQNEAAESVTYSYSFDSLPGAELERILSIDIKHKFDEKYSGKYSYKLISGDSVLHGDFFLSFMDSSNYIDGATNETIDDMVRVSKMTYSGQFKDGKKSGQFVEKLLFDDGVDLYSKWIIKIQFENDQCDSATFSGVIGAVMPDTIFSFYSLKKCSFENVTDLAQHEWTNEWERRNNSR